MGLDEGASFRTASPRDAASPETTPKSMWGLAILALLPFPVSAAIYGYGPPEAARQAVTVLLTWSAVVLSFLAGVRWGLESGRRLVRRERLLGSFGFSIIAWVLLLVRWRFDNAWIIGFYIAAFMLQWLSDHAAPDTASRFPRLSTAVTAAACISLAVALDQAIRS